MFLSLRAERSNPHPVTHCDGDWAHVPGLGPGVASLLTLNQAAVICLVIPAQAGTQGGRA